MARVARNDVALVYNAIKFAFKVKKIHKINNVTYKLRFESDFI